MRDDQARPIVVVTYCFSKDLRPTASFRIWPRGRPGRRVPRAANDGHGLVRRLDWPTADRNRFASSRRTSHTVQSRTNRVVTSLENKDLRSTASLSFSFSTRFLSSARRPCLEGTRVRPTVVDVVDLVHLAGASSLSSGCLHASSEELPEHRDHLAMVGPGGDHQAHRPGIEPPEHRPRQQKALTYRPPRRHHRDRTLGDRPANLHLLPPELASEHLRETARDRRGRPRAAPGSDAPPGPAPRPASAAGRGNRPPPPAYPPEPSSGVSFPAHGADSVQGRPLRSPDHLGDLRGPGRDDHGTGWRTSAFHCKPWGVDGGSRVERTSRPAACDVV